MKTAFGTAALAAALAGVVKAEEFGLALTKLDKYPNYEGKVEVTLDKDLVVTLDKNNNKVRIQGQVSGLPADSEGGIHMHAGSSCAGSGPHYWEGIFADPWNTKWKSDADGVAIVNVEVEHSTLAQRSTAGRSIVIHDPEGKRAACGLIKPFAKTDFAAGALAPYKGLGKDSPAKGVFKPYPETEFTAETAPQGTVELSTDNVLDIDITANLVPSEEHGVRIHKGMTCEEAKLVGDSYWDTKAGEDPWTAVKITATAEGKFNGKINVAELENAFPFKKNVDHAVVIDKPNGDRFGCTRLSRVIEGQGHAIAYEHDGELQITGWAIGLEVDPSNQLKMSAHVHEGDSCDSPGGHLLANGTDPWLFTEKASVKFTNQPNGDVNATRARSQFDISTDVESLEDVTDKVLVMHDSHGTRVLCGKLAKVSASAELPVPSIPDDSNGGDGKDPASSAPALSGAVFLSAVAAAVQRLL